MNGEVMLDRAGRSRRERHEEFDPARRGVGVGFPARDPRAAKPGAPPREPRWDRLVPLLRCGVWITTVCFGAGLVVTWVRFESLAGLGSAAVVAADRGDIFVTGLSALIRTLVVYTIVALVLLGGALLHARLRRRRPWPLAKMGVVVRAGAAVWRYVLAHPWWVHLIAPVIAVLLARYALPRTLAVPVVVAALVSVLGGMTRGIYELVSTVAEGRRAWARRARVPVLLAGTILLTVWFSVTVVSWTPVASVITAAVFSMFGLWRSRGIPAEELTFTLLFLRERRLMAVLFLVFALGNAVASEADRPRGLTVAKVMPVQGAAFDAIPLGQHSGRAVFLKLADLSPRGMIEIAPGSLRSVAVTRTGVYGITDSRTFARRVLDWAAERNWSLQASGPTTRVRPQ